MLKFATEIGMKGLGYVKCDDEFNLAGPIAKFLPDAEKAELIKQSGLKGGDVLFFISDKPEIVATLAGQIRTELANRMGLIKEGQFKFCFIVDFPMYDATRRRRGRLYAQPAFHAAGGGTRFKQGPARHFGVPVRYCGQRGGAFERRGAQPRPEDYGKSVRDRGLYGRDD